MANGAIVLGAIGAGVVLLIGTIAFISRSSGKQVNMKDNSSTSAYSVQQDKSDDSDIEPLDISLPSSLKNPNIRSNEYDYPGLNMYDMQNQPVDDLEDGDVYEKYGGKTRSRRGKKHVRSSKIKRNRSYQSSKRRKVMKGSHRRRK